MYKSSEIYERNMNMKTEKRKNSALKKLIPAVAMLATSAVMLSTATYAWFTMNKEVQMTGLKMTATTGEGIEISLASVSESGLLNWTFTDNPSDDVTEKGWTNKVAVGDYYATIGKIKPSSSVNGVDFFDAKDASKQGKTATVFEAIDSAKPNAKLTQRTGNIATGTDVAVDEETSSSGYYVDIPVYIRTTKRSSTGDENGKLYCKMKISNGSSVAEDVLHKAVRVAFVTKSGTNYTNPGTVIVGADDTYYVTGQAVNAAGTNTRAAVSITKDNVSTNKDELFTNINSADTGLTLPYATGDNKYGHLNFIVRVWLEGESTSCYDAQAGQSWNIDFEFSLKTKEDLSNGS